MTCTGDECKGRAGACATCPHRGGDAAAVLRSKIRGKTEALRDVVPIITDWQAKCAILAKAIRLGREVDIALACCDACQVAMKLGHLYCQDHRQLYEDAEAAESEALVLIEKQEESCSGPGSPCAGICAGCKCSCDGDDLPRATDVERAMSMRGEGRR